MAGDGGLVEVVTVEIKPETQKLVQEEIQRGHFRSVDEEGVTAWRENGSTKPRKRLYELLTQPPFAGSSLEIERQKDFPRPVDLG